MAVGNERRDLPTTAGETLEGGGRHRIWPLREVPLHRGFGDHLRDWGDRKKRQRIMLPASLERNVLAVTSIFILTIIREGKEVALLPLSGIPLGHIPFSDKRSTF